VEKRLTQVYIGDGKGKTCAAVGQAVRALGRGWRVLLIQFLKPAGGSGETEACNRLEGFVSKQFGSREFVYPGRVRPDDIRSAQAGLDEAERALDQGLWDLVVLDEILDAASLGLVPYDRVLDLVRKKPETVELVLTGRHAPQSLIEAADLVSSFVSVKHPFEKGTPARKGIEF
jgi:cob(I)alamin adenosyltransferase